MRSRRTIALVAGLALAAALLAYLHDPPWVGGVTSGMRGWEERPPGTRFRWTSGHATFYVPSDATVMTLPLRAFFPGPDGGPVLVDVSVDGRWLTQVVLRDPQAWASATLPLPRKASGRRHRRVELRVSRTVGQGNLGVMVGELEIQRPRLPGR